MDPTKIAIRASTQAHLDIEDIKDDLVILKDGSCCLVIGTTAVNYGLLSEREQEAIIYAYAGLLNSLTFTIQILIRSHRKDISSYLKLLKEAEAKTPRRIIKKQIREYRKFVREIVQKNEVLGKDFYLIIPMSTLELGITKTMATTLGFKRKLPFDKEYILEKAKLNLHPKRDHLLRLLSRLGLKGHQLNTQELIQLFFNIYNPGATGQEFAKLKDYQNPLVQSPPSQRVRPSKESVTTFRAKEGKTVQEQIARLVKESVLTND